MNNLILENDIQKLIGISKKLIEFKDTPIDLILNNKDNNINNIKEKILCNISNSNSINSIDLMITKTDNNINKESHDLFYIIKKR